MFPKSALKNLLFSFTVIFFVFFIAEVASVVVYTLSKKKAGVKNGAPTSEEAYFINHPTLGWYPSPGYDGFRQGRYRMDKERMYKVKVNSVGMRDREISNEKPKNTIRILCIGDSITEGPGVNNEATYPKLLENILNEKAPNKKYEVFNCGVGDYNTAQEVLFLRDIGLTYKPDVVILGYYLNDGRKFVPDETINLKMPGLNLLKKSRFVYYLNKIILKYRIKFQWKAWNKGRDRWVPFYAKKTWQHNRVALYNLIKLADRDWGVAWTERGWKEIDKNLYLLVALRDKYNFKLIVLNFPDVIQIYSDFTDDYLYYPQNCLRKYCLKRNIPYIDLIPFIKNYPMDYLFIDHCHYTPEGLNEVAKIVSKEFFKK